MTFRDHLAGLIQADGPLRLDRFMALANAHYYATRDPLGLAGDFTTAPEISQLFGELLGLCLVDFWERSGSPQQLHLVELGPGRGTLMADLLRASRIRPAFLAAAQVSLVETSPTLCDRQANTLRDYRIAWAASFDEIPRDAPLYLVANEFFDALPIRQFVHQDGRWHERAVGFGANGTFAFALIPAGPTRTSLSPPAAPAPFEINEPAQAVAAGIGERLRADGGIALIVDYGHGTTAFGDTLQAVRNHAFADPLSAPGEADLTAHVDFAALVEAAAVSVHGPVAQGDFLRGLGIEARAAALAKARPDRAALLSSAVSRLTAPDEMGTLFKAMALTGRGAPVPAGFPP